MQLPLMLAGPIVRRVEEKRAYLWFATSKPVQAHAVVYISQDKSTNVKKEDLVPVGEGAPTGSGSAAECIGDNFYVTLLRLNPSEEKFPLDKILYYDLVVKDEKENVYDAGELAYEGHPLPGFYIPSRLETVLYGSCRKPHGPGRDCLSIADDIIQKTHDRPGERPAALFMIGDQIYADDIGGPLIRRISELGRALTGWDETLPDMKTPPSMISVYGRTQALEDADSGFTSGNSGNHLLTFGEYAAMYLMTWNDKVWEEILPDPPEGLNREQEEKYREEKKNIALLMDTLPKVRRALANIATYMIFDDHDVTDDWQINRKWAHNVNNSPCGRRIVSNALAAYWAFQGWGNNPEAFTPDIINTITDHLRHKKSNGTKADTFDFKMWSFHNWDYSIQTDPPVIAIDSRTGREFDSFKGPARLVDRYGLDKLRAAWASLGSPREKDLLIIAGTPVYGFEPLELLQKIVTAFGVPVWKVDHESWIANRKGYGAFARCLAEKIRPRSCVMLSGDVHYAFTTKAEFKGSGKPLECRQCTSSAFKNTTKASRQKLLDRLASYSRPVEHRMGWNPDAPFYVKLVRPFIEFLVRFNIIKKGKPGGAVWTDTVTMLRPAGEENPLVTLNNIGLLRIKEDGRHIHEVHALDDNGEYKIRTYNL